MTMGEWRKAELRKKMRRRKVFDERCEASVGVDYSGSAPVIERCQVHSTKFIPEVFPFGSYLCEEHFEKWLES